jgi:hypothetical protein
LTNAQTINGTVTGGTETNPMSQMQKLQLTDTQKGIMGQVKTLYDARRMPGFRV